MECSKKLYFEEEMPAKYDETYFDGKCTINNNDARPTIHVNHGGSYFNITGSARFENLRFSGINAFAQPKNTKLSLKIINTQFCEINELPTGREGEVSIKEKEVSGMGHYCKDTRYVGSHVPTDTNFNHRCGRNSNN